MNPKVENLYDITIGYEGLKSLDGCNENEYPENIYTIPKIFLQNKGPKTVYMHIQKFKISDIPKDENLDEWIQSIFQQKDIAMDNFYKNGTFSDNYHTHNVKPQLYDYLLVISCVILAIFTIKVICSIF